MIRLRHFAVVGSALLLIGVILSPFLHSQDRIQDKPKQPTTKTDSPDIPALRLGAKKYSEAFNKGDAETLSKMWMADCEFVGIGGEVLKGRKAVKDAYADFFKKNPKAKLRIEIDSLKALGRASALEEGKLYVTLGKDEEPEVTRYSAIHVREDDKWLLAVVREFEVNPVETVSIDPLKWLVGEWTSTRAGRATRIVYQFDEDKVFLLGNYTISEKGKVMLKGTQRIGKDPALAQLRSWFFDSSGGFGEGVWSKQGKRWVSETVSTLPDGSVSTATNLIIPIDDNTFTFQSVARTLNDVELPDLPPIKVTRVKK